MLYRVVTVYVDRDLDEGVCGCVRNYECDPICDCTYDCVYDCVCVWVSHVTVGVRGVIVYLASRLSACEC